MMETIMEIMNDYKSGNISEEEAIKMILEKLMDSGVIETNSKKEEEKEEEMKEEDKENIEEDKEETEEYSEKWVKVERWLAPKEEKDYILEDVKIPVKIDHIDNVDGSVLGYKTKEDGVYVELLLPEKLAKEYQYLSPGYRKDGENKILYEISLTNNPKRKKEELVETYSKEINLPTKLKKYLLFNNNPKLFELTKIKTSNIGNIERQEKVDSYLEIFYQINKIK
jgi:23S rRNA A2030 N6-methylase RlmJ